MNVTDEMVEAGAIALRDKRNVAGVGDPCPWDQATETTRGVYRREARAVLEAVDAPADSLSDAAMEKLHEWMVAGGGSRAMLVTLHPGGDSPTDVTVGLTDAGTGVLNHDAILPMAVLGALDAWGGQSDA